MAKVKFGPRTRRILEREFRGRLEREFEGRVRADFAAKGLANARAASAGFKRQNGR